MSELYIQIGARLREARIRAGYTTSADFANKMQINKPTYSNHENGNKAISIETIVEYAQHLNVSWQYLVTGEVTNHDLQRKKIINDNYILHEELFTKVLIAIEEFLIEQAIKMENIRKAELIYATYTSIYDRSNDNSRFSIKDIKMCINVALTFDKSKK
jgi:transcriptional regulator with XRE-family HTH domain